MIVGADDDRVADGVRMAMGPRERLKTAERTADDDRDSSDPQRVERAPLRVDHVLDRDDREARSPAPSVGCRARRTGRAVAAAERVDTDDAPAFGIEERSRSDETRPPLDDPRRAGQRVRRQHDVRAVGSRRALQADSLHDVRQDRPGCQGEVADRGRRDRGWPRSKRYPSSSVDVLIVELLTNASSGGDEVPAG